MALLQQRTQELASEKQMAEMWMSELEVTSKAYDQEKKKNKQVSQEVTFTYQHKVVRKTQRKACEGHDGFLQGEQAESTM